MINVLYLPLDDRPCNEQFPYLLPFSNCKILPLPKGILGNKKFPANFDKIKDFLLKKGPNCSHFVISLDTLIYGGLIPSRLHSLSKEELLKRFEVLEEVKRINPDAKIYAYSTIMRCPNTNFDSEEPSYWSEYGKLIFRYGQLKDLETQNKLTIDEKNEFEEIKKKVPTNVIKDFETRRKTNLEVSKEIIKINNKCHIFSYFCLPQDDSNPIGWTAMDQRKIKQFIKDNNFDAVENYPGADEVGMVVLSRLIKESKNCDVKVFIHYPNSKTKDIIPPYEDRPIYKTVESQISVAGVKLVNDENDADFIIRVSIGNYDLSSLISYINLWKSKGKRIGIVDTFLQSGSDLNLIKGLKENNLLLNIDGYASWNTASNSFGTVLAEMLTLHLENNQKGNKKFLVHRYVDDYAYCSSVRGWTDVNAALARGYCEAELDGVNGTCTQMCHDELLRYLKENIPEVATLIKDIKVSSPWNRSFEMKFEIDYAEEKL